MRFSLYFLIPIGGGIPAGVLVAKTRGLTWPLMTVLYLISDVILAFVFEGVLFSIVSTGQKSLRVTRFFELFRQSMMKTIAKYGIHPKPHTLVMISFGVDPMTGRMASKAAGFGVITSWGFAITGDMVFFAVMMVSTLWLGSVLGDGTWTALAIVVIMTVAPILVRRLRERWFPIAS